MVGDPFYRLELSICLGAGSESLTDLSLFVQAFELHPACRCNPAFDNERVNCIYHFMGSLSFRRIF
jgi:hypothetical protein